MTEKVFAAREIEGWSGVPGTPYPAEPPDALMEKLRETLPAHEVHGRRVHMYPWKDQRRGVQRNARRVVVLNAS